MRNLGFVFILGTVVFLAVLWLRGRGEPRAEPVSDAIVAAPETSATDEPVEPDEPDLLRTALEARLEAERAADAAAWDDALAATDREVEAWRALGDDAGWRVRDAELRRDELEAIASLDDAGRRAVKDALVTLAVVPRSLRDGAWEDALAATERADAALAAHLPATHRARRDLGVWGALARAQAPAPMGVEDAFRLVPEAGADLGATLQACAVLGGWPIQRAVEGLAEGRLALAERVTAGTAPMPSERCREHLLLVEADQLLGAFSDAALHASELRATLVRELGDDPRASLEGDLTRALAAFGDEELAELLAADRGPDAGLEPVHRLRLAAVLELHGAEHPEVARAWSTLGTTCLQKARLDDAHDAWREALRVRRAVHPDASRATALDVLHLATGVHLVGDAELAGEGFALASELWRQLAERGATTLHVDDLPTDLALEALDRGAVRAPSTTAGERDARLDAWLARVTPRGEYVTTAPLRSWAGPSGAGMAGLPPEKLLDLSLRYQPEFAEVASELGVELDSPRAFEDLTEALNDALRAPGALGDPENAKLFEALGEMSRRAAEDANGALDGFLASPEQRASRKLERDEAAALLEAARGHAARGREALAAARFADASEHLAAAFDPLRDLLGGATPDTYYPALDAAELGVELGRARDLAGEREAAERDLREVLAALDRLARPDVAPFGSPAVHEFERRGAQTAGLRQLVRLLRRAGRGDEAVPFAERLRDEPAIGAASGPFALDLDAYPLEAIASGDTEAILGATVPGVPGLPGLEDLNVGDLIARQMEEARARVAKQQEQALAQLEESEFFRQLTPEQREEYRARMRESQEELAARLDASGAGLAQAEGLVSSKIEHERELQGLLARGRAQVREGRFLDADRTAARVLELAGPRDEEHVAAAELLRGEADLELGRARLALVHLTKARSGLDRHDRAAVWRAALLEVRARDAAGMPDAARRALESQRKELEREARRSSSDDRRAAQVARVELERTALRLARERGDEAGALEAARAALAAATEQADSSPMAEARRQLGGLSGVLGKGLGEDGAKLEALGFDPARLLDMAEGTLARSVEGALGSLGEHLGGDPDLVPRARRELAELLVRRGARLEVEARASDSASAPPAEYAEALEHLAAARAAQQDEGSREAFLADTATVALLLHVDGREADALALATDVVDRLEEARATVAGDALEAARWSTRRLALGDPYLLSARAHLAAAAPAERPAAIVRALEDLERGRGRALLELLDRRAEDVRSVLLARISANGDAELVDGYRRALEETEAAERALADVDARLAEAFEGHAGEAAEGSPTERLLAERSAAVARRAEALAELEELARPYLGVDTERPLTWPAVRAALREGELVLFYVLTDDQAWLFSASADRAPRVHELTWPDGTAVRRADVDACVRTWLSATAKELGYQATDDARPFHDLAPALLPAEVQERLAAASRVLLVPDGPLHLLPFEALTLDGEAERHDSTRWLDRYPALVVGPSLTGLLRDRARPRERRPSAALLAVGDPAFGTPRVGGGAVDPSLGELAELLGSFLALPGTRKEVLGVARLVSAHDERPTRVLLGQDATVEALEASWSAPRFLLLATHGVSLSEPFVRDSCIALAGAGAEPGAGLLRLGDVLDRWAGRLTETELAVLSGCRTAVGSLEAGEGGVALSWGFLYAGARAVIASRWNLKDQASALQMARFYELLLVEGLEHPEALHESKRWLSRLTLRELQRELVRLLGEDPASVEDIAPDDDLGDERPYFRPLFWASTALFGEVKG